MIRISATVYLGAATYSDNGSQNIYDTTVLFKLGERRVGERFRFIPDATNDRHTDVCFRINGGEKIFLFRNLAYYLGALDAEVQVGDLIADTAYEVEMISTTAAVIIGDRRVINPLGGGWNPAPGVASGGASAVSTTYATFERIYPSQWVRVLMAFSLTTGGTPAHLTIVLPFISANLGATQVSMCSVQDPTTVPGFVSVQNNSTEARIVRSDLAAFGTGATRGAFLNFSYLAHT